jgi:hypothetical protein
MAGFTWEGAAGHGMMAATPSGLSRALQSLRTLASSASLRAR